MQAIIKRLELATYDVHHWQVQNIFTAATIEGQQVAYQGDALVSIEEQGHTVEFKTETLSYRPAEIDIPISVTSNASVELSVNGVVVETIALTAQQPEPPLFVHRLKKDITEWTEPQTESRIRLEISYLGARGKTTILLDNDQPTQRPQLLQPWLQPYAIKALLYTILTWGSLLGLMIFIIANTKSFISDVVRFWSAVITVLIWFSGMFGFTDLVKIPIRKGIRWFYGETKAHRGYWLAALSVIFILASIGVGTVVYCSYIRYRYTKLINNTLEQKSDDLLRRAFIQQPWRKEAQIIFEAYSASTAVTTGDFRNYVRNFISDPEVKRTIEGEMLRKSVPYCLAIDGASAYNDPVVWFASILPEGEEEEEKVWKTEAIRILSSRDGPLDVEARMLKVILELAITKDDKQTTELEQKLRKLLSENSTPRGEALHTYQVAWDTLAQLSIKKCSLAKTQNLPETVQSSVNDAIADFLRVIEIRSRQTQGNNEILWHRPPSKLALFQLFRYEAIKSRRPDVAAQIDREVFSPCPEFKAAFDKEIKEKFPDYAKTDVWFKGTVLKEDYISYIRNTLMNKGWRY
jgi:hypothetical protein